VNDLHFQVRPASGGLRAWCLLQNALRLKAAVLKLPVQIRKARGVHIRTINEIDMLTYAGVTLFVVADFDIERIYHIGEEAEDR
jgi:hypothetical protein